MARGILWAVAILEAFVLLVAGCVQVDVPEGPYVVTGERQVQASPKDREQVEKMDKAALQDEVLRLTAENDRLRQEMEKQKREIKTLKDRIDRLEDQIENLRDR